MIGHSLVRMESRIKKFTPHCIYRYNFTVDITQHQSLQWVKKHVATSPNQPFFLYQAYTVPHAGGWGHAPTAPESGAPVPSDGQYAKETWPDVEKDHAAVITYLDNYVGEMVNTISDLGVEKNTIMFFASDNGAHLEGGHSYHFFNSTGGLLGHKRSLYEGGVRPCASVPPYAQGCDLS